MPERHPDVPIDDTYVRDAERPDGPLHLGGTEAGLLPDGEIKTRIAFEKLLAQGIGDTIRVSLTLPNERKQEEVTIGLRILDDVVILLVAGPGLSGNDALFLLASETGGQ